MSDKKNIKNSDDDRVLKTQDSTLTSEKTSAKPASANSKEIKVIPKESFIERWKTNRFWLIRASYYILRTVWIIVMAIGGFIAWLISLLFI